MIDGHLKVESKRFNANTFIQSVREKYLNSLFDKVGQNPRSRGVELYLEDTYDMRKNIAERVVEKAANQSTSDVFNSSSYKCPLEGLMYRFDRLCYIHDMAYTNRQRQSVTTALLKDLIANTEFLSTDIPKPHEMVSLTLYQGQSFINSIKKGEAGDVARSLSKYFARRNPRQPLEALKQYLDGNLELDCEIDPKILDAPPSV